MRFVSVALPVPVTRRKHPKPFAGKVRLGWDSSVRKLARAFKRGKVAPERMAIIEVARQSAERRHYAYIHGLGRKRKSAADKMALWHDRHAAAFAGSEPWQIEGRDRHERAAAELRKCA